jgi:ABC-2 type transport system ATP-binding protein
MDGSTIEVRRLVRRFGDFTAVDDISFNVPRGCFFGFLGPNGAGKSTTLRMLTGLLPPTSGDALIEGLSVVTDGVEVKRRIGVVPDNLALFDRLSLWEHLTLAGQIHGLSRTETESRATDLLRLMELWEDRGTMSVDASHGMRKKTALGMALIHGPRVLLLDEPFEGIDPIAGKVIRDLLTGLAGRGVTIVITSHILEVIERLVDRIAIMVKGRIAVETTAAEVRASGRTLEDVFVEAAGLPADRVMDLPWLS